MNTRQFRVIGLLGLVFAILLGFYAPLQAATATGWTILSISEDRFYNYDILDNVNASYNNVDWAITMLFWNNASVQKVKNDIYTNWWQVGNTMYEYATDDGSTWGWMGDSGTKDTICTDTHIRLYAPGGNRFYNIYWGYYVLASSHMDINDCPWFSDDIKWYGYSEDAEHTLAQVARNKGYPVIDDWGSFYNNEPYRVDPGHHVWLNNEYATGVYVP